jgi:hypothetical protein
MSEYQEYKVTNTDTQRDVFFVKRAFESAHQQAQAYIARNRGKFPMKLHQQTRKPKPFPRWEWRDTIA